MFYSECRESMFSHFLDFEPVSVANKTVDEWMGESLEDCILNDNPQCVLRDGEIVDHQFVSLILWPFNIFLAKKRKVER